MKLAKQKESPEETGVRACWCLPEHEIQSWFQCKPILLLTPTDHRALGRYGSHYYSSRWGSGGNTQETTPVNYMQTCFNAFHHNYKIKQRNSIHM